MKRFVLTIAALAFLPLGLSTGPFDQKLSQDQQIIHALNRLTFGPRPGDIENVRRIGLNKWVELQLHPEKIAENPVLDAKLKPFETLRMTLPEIVEKYTPEQNNMMMMVQPQNLRSLLPQQEFQKVQMGTAEERTEVLKALDPEKRKKVLAALPENVIQHTPEYKKEAEDLRRQRQQEVQKQRRLQFPQLGDLLTPEQITVANNGTPEQIAALLSSFDEDKRAQLAGALPPEKVAAFPELRRDAEFRRTPRIVASDDARQAKVFRALYSNRQLQEVLVDFWYNHFNVDQNKNTQRVFNIVHLLVGGYERDAIRPHVLGHFKDLLLATARHPAMLYYLDNWESVAPGMEVGPFAPFRGVFNGVPNSIIPGPLGRVAHGLNENYGREVMELHTLGVKGGYTQEDVIAVARCFTGWTVRSSEDPEFVFAPFMHDNGEKVVLGHKIPAGGGEEDGLKVIDILAHHPSTAKFISRELAQRFVADNPPQALVDRMAQTFMKTDGDLRAVLETMFTSPQFFSEGAWEAKIKSPFEMVVSAVRAVGGEATDTYALTQKIADMGEPLYSKIEPTGYPNTGDLWLSTVNAIGRMNFSVALATGQVPGVTVDPAHIPSNDFPSIARSLLGRDASTQTQNAIEHGLDGKEQSPQFIASLVLGSPDFQRR